MRTSRFALQIIITLAALLAFFAGIAAVMGYLIANGDWSALKQGSSWVAIVGITIWALLFWVAIPIFLVLQIVRDIALLRTFGDLRRQEMEDAPPIATQPDRRAALPAGETLSLRWRRRVSAVAGEVILLVVVLGGVVAALNVFCIVELIIAFRDNPLNPFAPFSLVRLPMPVPTFNDWLVLGYAPVVVFLAMIVVSLSSIANRTALITADDQGIQIRQPLRRQSVSWDAIRGVLHAGPPGGDPVVGAFWLVTEQGAIAFKVDSRKLAARSGTARSEMVFDGGYAQYHASAAQLLATIVARTQQPIRTSRQLSGMLARLRRRFPLSTIDLDVALTAPVAGPQWQPPIQSASLGGKKLQLIARLPGSPGYLAEIGVWTMGWNIGLGAYFWFSGIGNNQNFDPTSTLYVDIFLIVFCEGISILIGWMFAYTRRRQRLPGLVLNGDGIYQPSSDGSSNRLQIIPWWAFDAWAVIPVMPRQPDTVTYMLFSGSQRVAWTEPRDAQLAGRKVRGDRTQAFRDLAEEIHLLIAAKTGLPLREIRLDNQHSESS